MFSQITFFIGLVALCQGGLLVDDQGHQTVSSQFTPLVHAGPLVHGSPVLDHSSLLQHGPLVQTSPYIQHAAPVAIGHAARLEEEHYAPARYEYSYSVEDPHTGDHKSQHEARDGDVVKGEYSLVQPDGSIRKVEYTADAHSGFNAVVHTSAPNAHAIPGVVPVAHAAPVHSAPLVHAGPVIANFHH